MKRHKYIIEIDLLSEYGEFERKGFDGKLEFAYAECARTVVKDKRVFCINLYKLVLSNNRYKHIARFYPSGTIETESSNFFDGLTFEFYL